MKYLILLLFSLPCFCQLTDDQQKVLSIELNLISKEYPNRMKALGDTLLIYRQATSGGSLADLKQRLISNDECTVQEANDVFGSDSISKFSRPNIIEWQPNDLKGGR